MLKVQKIKVESNKMTKLKVVVENRIQPPRSYTNREYKDRLFKFIFKDKEKLLSLYNALNDTHYTNPEDIEITTLEDVIYCNMKNDVSFIIDDRLSLFEHQSTLNRNMPLRGFLYFAKHFEKYIEEHHLNIYRSALVELPTPKFVVFYNGNDMKEDRILLRLSDSFSKTQEKACMELEALVLNINYGKNKELMNCCRPLMEYSYFIKIVKQYSEKMERDCAINMAVDACITENILKDILTKNRAEVVDMLLTEYNEEKIMSLMEDELEEMKARYEQAKLEFKIQLEQEQLEKQEFKSQLEQKQMEFKIQLKQEQLEKQEFKSQLEQKQLEIETLLKKYENLKGNKSEASK